jgi:5-formyltetrahydrofolate cyclo-ligase
MSCDGDMKAVLRARMLDELSRIDAADVARQSAHVVARVLENEWYIRADRVSVYVSMANEIDTEPIIRHALASGACEWACQRVH